MAKFEGPGSAQEETKVGRRPWRCGPRGKRQQRAHCESWEASRKGIATHTRENTAKLSSKFARKSSRAGRLTRFRRFYELSSRMACAARAAYAVCDASRSNRRASREM